MASTKPTADDALNLSRRRFVAGRRVDMTTLADELGVNRVTLYRWVGSRERLLVDVIWGLAERTLALVLPPPEVRGGERIVRIVVDFLDATISNHGFRTFLEEEGELAMRLLTRQDKGFQQRLIARLEELLREEAEPGHLDLHGVDPRELAYVIARVIESYTYLDLITGEQADAQRAEPVLRLLLR